MSKVRGGRITFPSLPDWNEMRRIRPAKRSFFNLSSVEKQAVTLLVNLPLLTVQKMWHQPEAERTVHPHPCSCPGQCGGNHGSFVQAQRHKSNTWNWENKFRLLEMDDESMKWCEWTNHQDLMSLSSCRMQSAKLLVGKIGDSSFTWQLVDPFALGTGDVILLIRNHSLLLMGRKER